MSAEGKAEIIALVSRSGLPRSRALAQLRLPRSTYYRWLKRLSEGRLKDNKGGSPIPWNKIRTEEETRILGVPNTAVDTVCYELLFLCSGVYLLPPYGHYVKPGEYHAVAYQVV